MTMLSGLRRSYERGALDESDMAQEPLDQFRSWFDQALAAGVPEPNAMTLSTVGANGRPSSRVVLIKDFDQRGIVWYTNYESRKGRELEAHPWAALQFYWMELERVVRIEGSVERVEPAQSDAYFASRPLPSRIGAWASQQSRPLASRASLLAQAAEYGLKLGLQPPRPPHWGGYRLLPDYWEFWQGRPSRLHDRITYRRDPGSSGWLLQRLAP